MSRINVSRWLRLIAFPALLLVIAYAACALPASSDAQHRQLPSVASKPYADSGSNRAKAVRPARAQARLPKAPGADGKTEDSSAGSAALLRSGLFFGLASSAGGRVRLASKAVFEPFPFRTRHPRDPPGRLI